MKKPETKWEVWEHFGGLERAFQLSEGEEHFLQWEMFKGQDYIFVEDREEREIGWCSRCREHVILPEWAKHKADVNCPHCGTAASVRHVWRGILSCRGDDELAILYGKSVLDPETVTARVMLVSRSIGGDYVNTREPYRVLFDSWYVFQPKLGGSMVRPERNWQAYDIWEYGKGDITEHYEFSPKVTKRCGTYRAGGSFSSQPLIIRQGGLREAWEDSPLRYGLEDLPGFRWRKDAMFQLLDWTGRYTSIERLIKMGLGKLVMEHMEGDCWKPRSGLNWRGKTVEKIFGGKLTKADKRYLLEHGEIIGGLTIMTWKEYRGSLSMEEAVRYQGCSIPLKKLAQYVPLRRALTYMEQQEEHCGMNSYRLVFDYLDYLKECEKLGYDLKKKSVLWPKDLQAAHQRTLELVKYKENELLEAGWQARRKKLEKAYCFETEAFRIVVPEKVNDLIREGRDQHNCVGGYVKRVANGETDVVYIRKTEEPEKSFGTMEIREGSIIQARAAYNKDLPEDAKAFVEEFRQEVLEKRKSKRMGRKAS